MSAPAQNAVPLAFSTIILTRSSISNFSKAVFSSAISSKLSAFLFSGRFSVIKPTLSLTRHVMYLNGIIFLVRKLLGVPLNDFLYEAPVIGLLILKHYERSYCYR